MKVTEDHTVERVARFFFSAACVSADFLYLTAIVRSLAISLIGLGALITPAVAQTTRLVVVLVHGRGQRDRGQSVVHNEWWTAIEKGLQLLTRRPLLDKSDVEFIWYADVLAPGAPTDCTDARNESAIGTHVVQPRQHSNHLGHCAAKVHSNC